MRIVSGVMLAITLAGLGIALLTARRETRVRVPMDLARLVVSSGVLAVLTAVGPPEIAWPILAGGLVIGVGLGVAQGSSVRVRLATGPTLFVRRSRAGIAAWAAGILMVQAAGVANRTGLLDLGRGASALGVGILAGTLVGRQSRVGAARAAWARAAAAASLLVVVASPLMALAGASSAEAQGSPPAPVPECPPSLGGMGLWDNSGDPRYSEQESMSGAPYGLGGLDCSYNQNPDGTDFLETGRYAITLSWTVGDYFGGCESRDGQVEEGTPAGGDDHFTTISSGTHNAWASIQGRDGTHITYGDAEALVEDLLEQASATATPCETPEPMPPDSPVTCPEQVDDLERSGVIPGEYEGQHWITCQYAQAYVDERETGGDLSATWFESVGAAQEGDEAGCGRPADDTGDGIATYHSADRYASAGLNTPADSGYRDSFEAEVGGMLEQAEALSPECTEIVGPGSGLPDDSSEADGSSGAGPDDDDTRPDGSDDEIDPADAALLAGAGLAGAALAAGIGLVESGRSASDVVEAWRRGGLQGLDALGRTRSTTVELTGDEARAVLEALRGDGPVDIDIPFDQQWEVYVAGGGEIATEGHLGARGRVNRVSGIVESEDEIVISVEVDVEGAPTPAPDATAVESTTPEAATPASAPASAPAPAPAPAPDRFTDDQIGDAVTGFLERPRGPDDWSAPAPVQAPTPEAEPTPPPPGSASPPRAPLGEIEVPEVTPEMIDAMGGDFDAMVAHRREQGVHWVRNPDLVHKAINNFPLNPWRWSSYGGQCGEFGEWGREWSEHFVKDRFGEGARVDTIEIEEPTSRSPAGISERLDSLVTVNHRATRVILPNGERYVLDYWEALGRNRHPAFVPEREWVDRWQQAVGGDGDDWQINRSDDEMRLKTYIEQRGEEEGIQVFRTATGDSEQGQRDAQTIINSWRREPW